MSSANELLAVKSLGISPMTLIWPVLILAFVLSLFVVWLNDVAVSWGRLGAQRVILESVEEIAYGMLRARRSYSCERFSINVKEVDGEQLVRPTVTLQLADDQPPLVVTARHAILRCHPKENELNILLTDGEVSFGENRYLFPDTQIVPVPLWAASRKGQEVERPADTPLRSIPRQIQTQHNEIEDLERSLAAEAASQLFLGDFEGLTGPEWVKRNEKLSAARSRLSRLHTEPWRRWANGFSCLAFAIVGVPLAIRLRNSDIWTSFAACFLPILIIYYPLLMYGVKLAKAGDLPPFCVWLGNLAFLTAGYWLLKRTIRR
jgi:lipopolysaccharide export system permease protein